MVQSPRAWSERTDHRHSTYGKGAPTVGGSDAVTTNEWIRGHAVNGQEGARTVSELIEAFYYTFGAIPSANATWPGPIRPKREGENE